MRALQNFVKSSKNKTALKRVLSFRVPRALQLHTTSSSARSKSSTTPNKRHFSRLNKKQTLTSAGLITMAGVLLFNLLAPTSIAQAERTLTWSTNGDFARNKSSLCQQTSIDKLSVSGEEYKDDDCEVSSQDASLGLKGSELKFLEDIKSITTGGFATNSLVHSLALKEDGTVWAWGSGSSGQLGNGGTAAQTRPVQVHNSDGSGFLTDVVSVSAGGSHSLALKEDGTVWAWGSGSSGRLGNGGTSQQTRPVQVHNSDGSGFLTDVVSVTAGSSHSIAIKEDGTVWAWGDGSSGRLGNGGTSQQTRPVQVHNSDGSGFLTDVVSAATGSSNSPQTHSLALKEDGTVWAWGFGSFGQLGDGLSTQQNRPVQVRDKDGGGFMTGVASVSAGSSYSLAVKEDGTVWAWGQGSYGKLGNGGTSQQTRPVQVHNSDGSGFLTDVVSVAAGNSDTALTHSLAVKEDGTVWAWGSGSSGQLGDGSTSQQVRPVQVQDYGVTGFFSNTEKISTGATHSLAVKEDGTVWAWGSGNYGQLGNGDTAAQTRPVQVHNSDGSGFLTDVVSVSAGGSHSLALKEDGTVWAWGRAVNGQLGNGSAVATNQTRPVQVHNPDGSGFLTGVTAVAAGSSHSLAVKDDGTVWAWGDGSSGRLGNGGTSQQTRPVQVHNPDGSGFLTDVTAVSSSVDHTLAIKGDGTVWAWGRAVNGQLGNGSTATQTRPVQVHNPSGSGFLTDVTAVAAGSYHSLAVKEDGTVWAWGYGYDGQLGNGSAVATNQTRPVQVHNPDGSGFLTDVAAVSVGRLHSLAVKNDGTVWAWGSTSNGVIGNGNTPSTNFPRPVQALNAANQPLTGATAVAAGHSHSLAVAADGSLYSWGLDTDGRLGRDYSPNTNIYYTADNVVSADGYAAIGSLSGLIVDFGPTKRTRWKSLNWNTDPLPENTTISLALRTSHDGNDWSDWTSDYTQDAVGSTSGSANVESVAMTRFAEIKVTMTSPGKLTTPTLHDFSLNFRNDTTTPITNAHDLIVSKSRDGEALANNAWTNKAHLSWQAGEDEPGGTGIWGYCVYVGKNAESNVTQTKGVLGESPIDTNGACPYVTAETSLDLAAPGVLAQALETSNEPYHVLVKALDNSGNVYADGASTASFRYDNTPPKNPQFISAPSQFIATKDVTLTWPTSGNSAASDQGSGIAGLQYRIGNDSPWHGAEHSGSQDMSDLLTNNGTYTTVDPIDYDRLVEGNNIVAFRTFDNAGNVSVANVTTVIKINTSSPSTPQDLTVAPTANTKNNFSFEWKKPASFQGSENALTYCYSVNALPTAQNCTYLEPGTTSLPEGPYATQPGENTMYVVARDEAGNINYGTAASTTFTANTSAPGVPRSLEVADISVKDAGIWKLTIAWEPPLSTGAGVASYRVLRSTDNQNFTQVATTSGTSHIETGLEQRMYYYKVRACDSANNCGITTESAGRTPNGRFTSPANLIASPSVEVKNRTARIVWTTDRTSDSRVQIGTSPGVYFDAETSRSQQVKNHSIELNNLLPDTQYYYTARWTDEDGNVGTSSELTFRTLPAPSVKDVSVNNITLNAATLNLTSRDASQVKVYYGISDSFGGLKEINTSTDESAYTVELDGLSDGTPYFYKITTVDSDGNEYDSNRIDTFTTPPRPRIENLQFQPVEGEPTSTQQVTWKTNVPATSLIRYQTEGASLIEVSDSTQKTEHNIVIRGLLDDSLYSLVAESRDGLGNLATSDTQTFQTALDTRPPEVSGLRIETAIRGVGTDARGQLIVSWRTDEPATSSVAYGKGVSGNTHPSSTAESQSMTTEHMVVISDLDTSQVYHLQPVSKDKSGNTGKGNDRSAIIGKPSDSVLDIILGTLERIFGL